MKPVVIRAARIVITAVRLVGPLLLGCNVRSVDGFVNEFTPSKYKVYVKPTRKYVYECSGHGNHVPYFSLIDTQRRGKYFTDWSYTPECNTIIGNKNSKYTIMTCWKNGINMKKKKEKKCLQSLLSHAINNDSAEFSTKNYNRCIEIHRKSGDHGYHENHIVGNNNCTFQWPRLR